MHNSLLNIICYLEKNIQRYESSIEHFKARKQIYLDLNEKYKNLRIHNNCLVADLPIEEVSGMQITRRWVSNINVSSRFQIQVSFNASPTKNNGLKIFNNPLTSVVAIYGGGVIKILDYTKIISDESKFKKKFLKRIKSFLIKDIGRLGLSVTQDSYNAELFKAFSILS